MALPSPKVATLSLRCLSLAFLLLSLIFIFIDKTTLKNGYVFGFKDVHSYRYMLGTIVIGIGYTLVQTIAFVVLRIIMENDRCVLIEFYGDKVISYILATGAAAGFGATRDLEPYLGPAYGIDEFFTMGYASASLLFVAFVCTAILSIMSYALPKTV